MCSNLRGLGKVGYTAGDYKLFIRDLPQKFSYMYFSILKQNYNYGVNSSGWSRPMRWLVPTSVGRSFYAM